MTVTISYQDIRDEKIRDLLDSGLILDLGGVRKDFPNLDCFSHHYIGLPVHMGMTEADAEYVVETIRSGW